MLSLDHGMRLRRTTSAYHAAIGAGGGVEAGEDRESGGARDRVKWSMTTR